MEPRHWGLSVGTEGRARTAGGWVKVKRGGEGAATALPRFTVPFSLLEADEALGVRVWRDGAARDPDAAALRIDVLDESTLRIRAALGSPLGGGGYSSGADIVLAFTASLGLTQQPKRTAVSQTSPFLRRVNLGPLLDRRV